MCPRRASSPPRSAPFRSTEAPFAEVESRWTGVGCACVERLDALRSVTRAVTVAPPALLTDSVYPFRSQKMQKRDACRSLRRRTHTHDNYSTPRLNAPHNATWQGRKMRHPRVQRVHPCAHRPTHEEDSRGTNTQTHTRSPRSAKRPRMVCARDKESERGRRTWHVRTTPPAPASATQLAHTRTHASSDDAGAHAGDERSAPREEA